MRQTIAQIAHQYLTSRGFESVGYGDAHLLHEIAEMAGMPHESWKTEARVLNALEGSPLFEKWFFRANHGLARRFTAVMPPNKRVQPTADHAETEQ